MISAAVVIIVLCHIDRERLRFLTTALKSPVTSVESLIASVKKKITKGTVRSMFILFKQQGGHQAVGESGDMNNSISQSQR